ncbi:MAG: HNH endonuclease [Bacteroidia bacterium]|nr:HNH endonuclease [Bacteroidia bacterium]
MEITAAQYRRAIKESLSEKLFNVLQTMKDLPDGKVTAAQLAEALKTNVQAAHSKIGYIGKVIADNLSVPLGIADEGGEACPAHFQLIGDYIAPSGESMDAAPVWKMNANLRKALKQVKADEKGIGELAAFKVWKLLCGAAKEGRNIGLADLSEKTKAGYKHIMLALERINEHCLCNNLPPLTIIAVSPSGKLLKTYNGWEKEKTDRAFRQVCRFDWYQTVNPFDSKKKIFTDTEIIKTLVANPERSKEMYARVKVRGKAQPLFRKALIDVYGSRCALCGFSVEHALEASHIVAWSVSKSDEKLDVRNGILLCATHHKLFDSHLIRINNDFSISVRYEAGMPRRQTECDKMMIGNLCNRKMVLPRKKEHWPRVEYIEKRNNVIKHREP